MRQQQPRNRLTRNRAPRIDHRLCATWYSCVDQREAIALANEVAVDQSKLSELMAMYRDLMNLHIATVGCLLAGAQRNALDTMELCTVTASPTPRCSGYSSSRWR